MYHHYLKAIHIHTDLKFIIDTKKYEGKYFENQVIIINNQRGYKGPYEESAHFFNYAPKSVNKIVELCEGADLVVLYDLDTIKCEIALKLPSTISIAWRFFGYELYRRDPKPYLSVLTLKASALTGIQKIYEILQRPVRYAKTGLVWGLNSGLHFQEAIRRVNIFLGLSREEYNLLKTRWPELPGFVKIPLRERYISSLNLNTKEKLVILGNNRSFYNNHLDIINIINSSSKQEQYQFVLLFNYGPESNYSKCVRDEVKDKQNYYVIDEFMPYNELCDLYQRAGAAILNGYRQMALGNIFLALNLGVKVYLNDRNIVMRWLLDEGFKIYSIEDLASDLENDNLCLNSSDAVFNAEQLKEIQKLYTVDHFQEVLSSLILEKTLAN